MATGTIDELDDTDVLTEPAEELRAFDAAAEPTDAASELLAEPVAEAPAEATPQPAATAELPEHVREHYDAIREKEREVRELECVYLDAKREAKDAKEEFDLADKSLRDLISRGPDPQRKLPLVVEPSTEEQPAAEQRRPKLVRLLKDIGETLKAGQKFDAAVDADGDVSILAATDDPVYLEAEQFEVIEWHEPSPPRDPDAWRKTPLTELGLTLKQNELFAEIGVTTIGGLEGFRAEIAEGHAAWPKGIGPAKVTDIENRIVDWLDKNRDKFGESA